jgi:hypothetical protein
MPSVAAHRGRNACGIAADRLRRAGKSMDVDNCYLTSHAGRVGRNGSANRKAQPSIRARCSTSPLISSSLSTEAKLAASRAARCSSTVM